MGIGNFTKQLATDAIADVLSTGKPEQAAAAAPENLGTVIVKQVQAMQSALKDSEELMVLFHNGIEALRVLDFFQPSGQLVVMTGLDEARNVTRVILPGDRLQLTCKVMKVQAGAAPVRVRFVAAK
jgi:3-hydroxymyristoyl/3-hydroxydecanoyl-(acyl carrier protein) dehydratase